MIDPDNHIAVIAGLLSIVAVGFLSERTAIGRRLSGAVVVLILALAASSLGVMPVAAPSYSVVWSLMVPLAIALYLIEADIISIVRNSGRALGVFIAGAAGVCAGAVVGALVLNLGPNSAELAAVFSATYSGGSLNFAAVAEAVDMRDGGELAAAVAVDNVLGIGFFMLLSFAGNWRWMKNGFPWRASEIETASAEPPATTADEVAKAGDAIDATSLSLALALAAVLCAVGFYAANLLNAAPYRILFVTVLTVAFATVIRKSLRRLRGAEVLAAIIMYTFFAALGTSADLRAMVGSAHRLVPFVLLIFVFHIAFALAAARLLKLNYREIVIGSAACIGGPPIAVAYAVLFGWRRLAGAAVAIGVFGYVVGNFVGVGVFEAVSILTDR